VGYDVNAVLLDRLGTENHGLAEYVRPGENIEAAVSNFYSKIQNPALTDVTLDFGGARVRDTYPRAIPDLFRGGQLVVVGRYRDAGTRTITLTGAMGDKKQTFTYKLDFNNRTDREEFAFVSRLWAQKKIGWLIEQIRLKGENKEYVDEIVKLSTRYGIMTEYTSFLAREDVNIHDVAGNVAETHRNLKARTSVQTGVGGVNQAMQSGAMQTANQAPGQAQFLNEEGRMVTMKTVKIIGSKTFYLKKGVWVDSEYREGMKIVELKQFDNPYFDLANKAPTQAQYMTFAPKESIIVVIDGVAYKIAAPK
jgi:Ca-activated chloride channel family protein